MNYLTRKQHMKHRRLPLSLLVLALFTACSPWLAQSKKTQEALWKASPQYRDGKFSNPTAQPPLSLRDGLTMIPEFLFGDQERKPNKPLPRQQVDLTAFMHLGSNHLSATWLGHSSLLINVDGFKLLSDPVFAKRVSPLGPTRYSGDLPVSIGQLPLVDAVLVSHDHYDHLNKSSIQALGEKTALFITSLGVGNRLVEWGIPRAKVRELDWWETLSIGKSMKIISTPAQHFSGRGLTDRNRTLWTSWVVEGPRHRIYISGDSGYFDGFAEIGERYGPFDMTFVECGAYNERWRYVHMFPEESVQAHLDLRGDVLHPIHWGTLNLALHPWYEPMQRLRAAAEAAGIQAATPIVGQTTIYGEQLPQTVWWEDVTGPPETEKTHPHEH